MTGSKKMYELYGLEADKQVEIEAAVFRRLLDHLDGRREVQNIDLMILAGFCRNCLSKWVAEEARLLDVDLDLEVAREFVYRMPYSTFKANHQRPVSDEKMKQFEAASDSGD